MSVSTFGDLLARRFRRNGVLAMLERDIITKRAPQRWQDASNKEIAQIDVIICFEDRIFDIVIEGLNSPLLLGATERGY